MLGGSDARSDSTPLLRTRVDAGAVSDTCAAAAANEMDVDGPSDDAFAEGEAAAGESAGAAVPPANCDG